MRRVVRLVVGYGRGKPKSWRTALAGVALIGASFAFATQAHAQFVVSNNNDSGTGSLRQAILNADAAGAPSGVPGTTQTITFDTGVGTITLASPLPLIYTNVNIVGTAGAAIDGASTYRGLFVTGLATTGSGAPPAITVNISDITIQNVKAQGGAGGDAGGGGGMGAGGALFVNQNAAVTLSNVSFNNAAAAGGTGTGSSVGGSGGGGGLGGNGGSVTGGGGSGGGGGLVYGGGGSSDSSGGGGGGGITSGGASPQMYGNNGGNGGAGASGANVGGGGGGGSPGTAGSAGGTGAGNGGNANGGAGGFGGGGGGGASSGTSRTGGNGGFGGGGGGNAGAVAGGMGGFGGGGGVLGNGGFGGGGGGYGSGGFGGGAGSASSPVGGGGGAAMGGAVFVASGGSLTIDGATTESGGAVTGGAPGSGSAGSGSAFGAGIFFEGGAGGTPATLAFGAGNQSIADAIADLNGSAGNTTTDNGLGGTGGITALAKSGGSTLTLSGASTYTGGTSLSSGAITVGASSTGSPGAVTSGPLGTGTLAMSAGTTLGFASDGLTIANAITLSGDPTFLTTAPSSSPEVISGLITDATTPAPVGAVVADGGGYIALTNANTYSGGTTICGSAIDGTCANANGTTPTTLIVNNSISGTSSSIGTGPLTFDGGVLQAAADNLSFNNAIALNSTGGTIDANGNSLTWTGAITNGDGTTGGLTIANTGGADTGVVTFTNTDSYTGATTINSGATLALSGSGSIATSSGVADNGTFDVSALTAGTSIVSLSGNGTVTLGANTLTLSNASGTFSGAIGGGGGLTLTTGTETLSGSSGYTGATTINGGTLEVDGSLTGTSTVTVNSGGTLTGTGTVDPLTVSFASGSTFTPGTVGVPGTKMTIIGNLVLNPGATYAVYLNPATSSFATINGTATLTGATAQANFASGSYVSKKYTILTASGGLGGTTFGGLTNVDLPAGASDGLSYDTGDVYLNLTAPFSSFTGLNVNQQNVVSALSGFFNTTGGIPAQFFNLTPNGLTQIDGEDATGAEHGAFDLMNEFLGLMLDPFVYDRGGSGHGGAALGFAPEQQASLPPNISLDYAGVLKAPPAQTFDRRWTAWGSGFGGSGTTNGDPVAGSNNMTASTYGYAGGMDYHYSRDTVFGFALAGGGANWDLAQGLGTGRSDAFLTGVYGVTHNGPAYLAGALALANNWFSTNRIALSEQLIANFQGQSYAGRLEGGYRFAVPVGHGLVGATPYAAIQAQDFQTPAYSETNPPGGFGLSYAAMNGTDTRSELGGRFDDLTALNNMPLMLRARVAWAHDWVSNPALNASFESLPGTSFTVFGAPIPHDSALTSAGAELWFTPSWSFIAKFDGEFASGSQLYAGSGTLRHTW